MITVIGVSSILVIVTLIIVTQSISGLRGAGLERLYEQALHVADAGIDHELFKLKGSGGTHTTGETLPASFATVQDEREWVLAAADAQVLADPDMLVRSNEGEWVSMRPSNKAVIYSVGFVPSKADPRKTRVLRAEYDFAPFSPVAALLTGGDLSISGNPYVDGTAGSAHANDDVTISGNPTLSGHVSSTDSYSTSGSVTVGDPASTGGGRPSLEIPEIEPRDAYGFSMYDLCPDGLVRAGPSYVEGPGANTTDTPCEGAVIGDADGQDWRGWKLTGSSAGELAKWDYSGNTAYNGVYYIYQGSAKVSGNPGTPASPMAVTIIAEGWNPGAEPDCPHEGGDIEISGNPTFTYNSVASPLQFVAGRDLKLSGGPTLVGALLAHEQFGVSGNPIIQGNLIAEDTCHTSGSPIGPGSSVSGNPEITYDGFEIPMGSTIRTTLWLEL